MSYKIAGYWNMFQTYLFPIVEEHVGPLSPTHLRLTGILDLIRIERFVPDGRPWPGQRGRPCKDRKPLARAFVAKIVFKFKYTRQLRDFLLSDIHLRQICGWTTASEIPSEAKFSRAFAEFAESQVPDLVHKELIKKTYEDQLVGHAVIDSTPVEAREGAEKKSKAPSKNEMSSYSLETTTSQSDSSPRSTSEKEAPKKRRRKTEKEKAESRSRCEKQVSGEFTLKEMQADLPTECAYGMKKKPGLSNYVWKGYKLHLASDPLGIPLAAVTTAANVNDHEIMIPLTIMLQERCTHLYQLMDSAYYVKVPLDYIKAKGIVPIVDKKPYTKKQKIEKEEERKRRKILNWKPAEDIRYQERKQGERPNALMKEYYGAGDVQYKGHTKVACHLMFGVLTLAAALIIGPG